MKDDDRPTYIARLSTDQATARLTMDAVSEIFDPSTSAAGMAEETGGRWTVDIHFLQSPDEGLVRELITLAVGKEAADALVFSNVAPRDWIRAGEEGLPPVEAGRLVVHGPHDRGRIALNRTAIEIEAALAFGTGHHGSTRGCLLALDGLIKHTRPKRILDIGTGTGVLAIAAAKVWRQRVVASDIDPRAAQIARENARLNRVGPLVEVLHATGLIAPRIRQRAPYDLVLGNILLGPLSRLAGPVARSLAPKANVVLSGLLTGQANAALAAYSARGLTLQRRIRLGGWATLVLARGARRRKHGPVAAPKACP